MKIQSLPFVDKEAAEAEPGEKQGELVLQADGGGFP